MSILGIGSSAGGIASGNASSEMLAKIGFSVTMTPTPFMLVKDFQTLGANVKSFRVPLKRSIQQVIIPSIGKNFEAQGRPTAWAPLADETMDIRVNRGISSDRILDVSGNLKKVSQQLSIWTITQDNAYVAALPDKVWYGMLHQSGYKDRGKTVPARPFIMFQEEDLDKIREVFADWLDERVAAVGFR